MMALAHRPGLDGWFRIARGAAELPACADTVAFVLARYVAGARSTLRFFDAGERELTRAGVLLHDFDLASSFQGDCDAFVSDGSFARVLDALTDAPFLTPHPHAGWFGVGGDAVERWGEPESAEIVAYRAALEGHRLGLPGWSPERGMSDMLSDPFAGRTLLESAVGGLWIGPLLLGRGTFPDQHGYQGELVCLRGTSTVIAVHPTEPWAEMGSATLGALAYGCSLLAAFEARRISLATLVEGVRAVGERIDLSWYVPFLYGAPASTPGLHLRGPRILDDKTSERIRWLRQLGYTASDPASTPLPPAEAAPSDEELAKPGVGLYWSLRSFLVGDDETLARVLPIASASRAAYLREAGARIASHLRGAPAGSGPTLGPVERPHELRAVLTAAYRALHPPASKPSIGSLSLDELAGRAWATVFDPIGLSALRKESLPAFAELDAQLAAVEAAPTDLSVVAWNLRKTDATALAPFLAGMALGGPKVPAHVLVATFLSPWLRADRLHWLPVCRAVARDARYGARRFDWLVPVGDEEDRAFLVEAANAASPIETLFLHEAMTHLGGQAAIQYFDQGMTLENPIQRLAMVTSSVRLGNRTAYARLAKEMPPLAKWGSADRWSRGKATIAAASHLDAQEREALRVVVGGPPPSPGAGVIQRLVLSTLGDEVADLEESALAALDSFEACAMLDALGRLPMFPAAVLHKALTLKPAIALSASDALAARDESVELR